MLRRCEILGEGGLDVVSGGGVWVVKESFPGTDTWTEIGSGMGGGQERRICLNVNVCFVHMCTSMTQSRQRELWVKMGGRGSQHQYQWEAAYLGTSTS